MPQLLVTTPEYLLRYDLETRRTWIVETGRPEYYGISWFKGSDTLCLGHSALDNALIADVDQYIHSEKGYLTVDEKTSPSFLSMPHQILCMDESRVLATNTGRNAIDLVNTNDWSVRTYRYGEALWDRVGVGDDSGNHLNSIFAKDGFVYVLAHNFTKGSFTLKLAWPSLELVETTNHASTGLHNLYLDDHGRMIACNSMQAGLVDLRSGEPLWTCDDSSVVTRGLAATDELIFVGVSENTGRASRRRGETGMWILDARSFETRDYHSLGFWGGVHEVRLLDLPDLCHPNGVLPLSEALVGRTSEAIWTERRLERVRGTKLAARDWDVVEGVCSAPGESVLETEGFGLALRRDFAAEDVEISAVLDVSDPAGNQAAVIARYVGPGEANMIAAILNRTGFGKAILSLWSNVDGVWSECAQTPLGKTCVEAVFMVRGSTMSVRTEALELTAEVPAGVLGKALAVGVRASNGVVRDFRATDLARALPQTISSADLSADAEA